MEMSCVETIDIYMYIHTIHELRNHHRDECSVLFSMIVNKSKQLRSNIKLVCLQMYFELLVSYLHTNETVDYEILAL